MMFEIAQGDLDPVASRLKDVVISVINPEFGEVPINSDSSLFDLGIDSLNVLELLVGIEKAFGITVAEDEVNEALFQRFGTLTQFVAAKVSTA